MPSINRVLAGDVLVRHLTQDERTLDADLLARHGRTARTLVKEGSLRLTLMGIAAGRDMPSHSADAPVTVHLLEGDVTFSALGREYVLSRGDLIVFAPGVEHAARSEDGCVFLITVVHVPHPPT